MRAKRTLLDVSVPLESATFGRPEVAPAGSPQKSCQRLRDWVPEGLILAGARLRGTALFVSLCKGFRKYPYALIRTEKIAREARQRSLQNAGSAPRPPRGPPGAPGGRFINTRAFIIRRSLVQKLTRANRDV